MPRAYSLDLRERVARFVSAGQSCHAAAGHFAVSVSFVVKLMQAYRVTGAAKTLPNALPQLQDLFGLLAALYHRLNSRQSCHSRQ